MAVLIFLGVVVLCGAVVYWSDGRDKRLATWCAIGGLGLLVIGISGAIEEGRKSDATVAAAPATTPPNAYGNCMSEGGSPNICAGVATAFGQKPPLSYAADVARFAKEHRPTPKPRPTPTPKPTPAPTPTVDPIIQEKRDFIAGVDESISGSEIAGNPYKYIGDDVDLHCTVMNVPDSSFFNANCGTDDDPAIIVIEHDSTDLDQGQSLRVLGTVITPMEGTNEMGGSRNFPTVEAKFMQ